MIGYRLAHHDALADAKAAGHVILAAMRKTGAKTIEAVIELERPPTRAPAPAAPRTTRPPRSKPAKRAKRIKPTERAEVDVPAAPPTPSQAT